MTYKKNISNISPKGGEVHPRCTPVYNVKVFLNRIVNLWYFSLDILFHNYLRVITKFINCILRVELAIWENTFQARWLVVTQWCTLRSWDQRKCRQPGNILGDGCFQFFNIKIMWHITVNFLIGGSNPLLRPKTAHPQHYPVTF